ncbi:MAG: DUF1289 domain-containing protein [Alcaligenaceae bacterium]|nr:DUF1289 domain-containing protein [Alcaligenaceae bacterium]
MTDDSFPRPTVPHQTGAARGVRDESLDDARHDDAHSLGQTDSPCVALCSTLYDDVCRGCGRTVLEVANWVFLDDQEKAEVWTRIRSQGFPKKR